MRARSRLSWVVLLLCACLAAGCRSTTALAGSPTAASAWAPRPAFAVELGPERRVRVACVDPAKSGLGPELEEAFTAAMLSRGYRAASAGEEADVVCELVVRYFGRTVPPDGREALLAAAGEVILGGDEAWLAPDGSGFDTRTRKPRAVRYRSRARGFFGELFRGKEADEWTLLVDVAIGTRRVDQPTVVQRHEGRVWASAGDAKLAKADARGRVLEQLAQRFPESLP